ncbi:Fc receptor-like protein 5, partial [Huso huso]
LPQTTLTLEPPFPEIFTGETVTLRCGVEGGSAGWKYLWYKDSEDTPVLQTAGRSITGDSYTITAAAVSDQGQYCCRGQRGDQPLYSHLSDKVILTVSELPKAVLTSSPQWGELYTGETVTLSCGVEGRFTGWRYLWYKSSQEGTVKIRDTTGASYTLSSVTQSHSGQYLCEAQRGDRPRSSQRSDPVTLTVSGEFINTMDVPNMPCFFIYPELPKAVLTSSPEWGELYTGETVTLSCGVEGRFTDWEYLWYKSSQGGTVKIRDTTGASYTLSSVTQSHSGQYQCEAQRGDRPRSSQRSDPVTLTVSELPQTTLTLDPPFPEIFTGETVSLRCGVEGGSAGWKYLWYKDSEDTPVLQTADRSITGDSYTITAAAVSDQGQYWCRGQKGGQPLYSQHSDPVILNITAGKPKPVLTRVPAREIFEGDTVTLSCVVEGGSDGWRYLWYKDSRETSAPQTDSSSGTGAGYTISAAALSHSGEYWCRAGRGSKPFNSQYSNAVNIQVSKRPQAVLTQEPAWTQIYESETVTLRCKVPGDYTEWRFTWYKAGRKVPATQDYYSSIDGDRYTISSATRDHSGKYTCQGVRTGNPSYSKTSIALTLRVSELPQTTLTLEPPFPEIFTGETVTLRCGVEVGSAGWKYLWYKDSEDTPVLQTAGRSITGDSYTITAAAVSDQGQYCCRGQRGDQPLYSQLSDKVILTVSGEFTQLNADSSYRSCAPFLNDQLPPTLQNKLSCHLVKGTLFPLHNALTGREGDLTPSTIRPLSQRDRDTL